MIRQQVTEFGRRLGMPSLELDNNGMAALDVERIGRLCLELQESADRQREPSLLVYIIVPSPSHDNTLPAKVLDMCHYRHGHLLPLVGGIHKEQLMLLTRLGERETSAAQIETAAHFLASMMAKLAS